MNGLRSEYQNQIPSISQQKTLERYRYLFTIFDLHREQAKKVIELMDYAGNLDFKNITDEQRFKLSSLKEEVSSFNNKITEVQFKMNNSNLN